MNIPMAHDSLFPLSKRQWTIIVLTAAGLGLAFTTRLSPVFLFLVSPWIMGTMIMVFDREGPLRNWLGPVLHSVFYPLALLIYNWTVAREWMAIGHFPAPLVVLGVNVLLAGCGGFFVRYLWPVRCPECQARGLVPLMPLMSRDSRTHSTHWCFHCHGQFWENNGTWRPERRKTWWDHQKESRLPHQHSQAGSKEASACG